MIYKTNIKNLGVLETLRNALDTPLVNDNWRIKKSDSNNYLILEEINSCVWFTDKISFIERFFDKLYNREFNSIFCGGLGLGVIPYLVQSFCDKIDVVEISQSNIDLIKNNTNYLDSKVNIINSDVRTFNTNEKYDVILLDIWTCDLESLETEKSDLISRYSLNLNEGGLLYLPLDGYYPQPT